MRLEGAQLEAVWKRALVSAAVALVVLLVFWPGTSGGYIFDDYSALIGNPAVQMTGLSLHDVGRALGGFELGGSGRPLSMLTFGLNHWAAGGFAPFGFKVTNVAVHALNAVLVLLLLERVFALLAWSRGPRLWWAACLAAIWAIHPLQVSSVLYVVQRMETLAATFVLLALLAYLAGRARQLEGRGGWLWIGATIPLVALGVLAKETAILFAVFALTLELTVLRFAAQSAMVARFWRGFYWVAVAVAVVGYLFLYLPRYGSLEPFSGRGFDSVERILTQLRVLPLYLQQILVPIPSTMTFYYDNYSASRGLFTPWTTVAGLVLLLGLFFAAVLSIKRVPLFALGVFWFLGAHLLSSNAQSLELVFEHRNYLALIGVLLAVFGLAREVSARISLSPRVAALLGTVLVVGIGALGMLRAATWGDPLLLATHQVDINPGSGRAKLDLGIIYYGMTDGFTDSPFHSLALRAFQEAADLPTGEVQASTNLILMKLGAGQEIPDSDWETLILTLEEQPVSPQSAAAVWALFDDRGSGGGMQPDRLLKVVETLFARREQPAYRYAQVGDYLREELGNNGAAKEYYREAVKRAGNEPRMIQAVINKLVQDGEFAWAGELGVYARSHGVELGQD